MTPPYKRAWTEGIEDDFADLSKEEVIKIDSRLQAALGDIHRHTGRVMNWYGHIRSMRVGDYRLLIYVDEDMQMVYGLAYVHRAHAYDKQIQHAVENEVKQLQTHS